MRNSRIFYNKMMGQNAQIAQKRCYHTLCADEQELNSCRLMCITNIINIKKTINYMLTNIIVHRYVITVMLPEQINIGLLNYTILQLPQ